MNHSRYCIFYIDHSNGHIAVSDIVCIRIPVVLYQKIRVYVYVYVQRFLGFEMLCVYVWYLCSYEYVRNLVHGAWSTLDMHIWGGYD